VTPHMLDISIICNGRGAELIVKTDMWRLETKNFAEIASMVVLMSPTIIDQVF
jgi:hypothetical protein